MLGARTTIDRLRYHPLLRAVRLDKMSLAALEATLMLHRDAPERVPVNHMLRQSEAVVASRAARLQALLGCGTIEPTDAFAGGGSLPEERIPSHALAIHAEIGVDALAERLRAGDPAVVSRIHEGRLLLDMLAVADADLDDLAGALRAVLG
jgi:L-seryl-tRNA(Ser) seleniumtransferase